MAVSLRLFVLRVADLDRSRSFYEALGLRFTLERHGSGPEHLAAEVEGIVFELYPRGTGPESTGTRIGFQVASIEDAVSALQRAGAVVLSPPTEGAGGKRAVIADSDGHRVELTAPTDSSS